jgi:head-tail adaptor
MAKSLKDRAASGRRDFYIDVQQVTDSIGTEGEPVETWATLVSIWASREDVDAPERFTEGMVMNQMSARAWMKWVGPYVPALDPLLVDVPKRARIMHEGRSYDIASANPIDRKAGVIFLTLSKAG